MKQKLWKIGAVASTVALLLCITGCASQGKTDSGEGYEISNQRIEESDGLPVIAGTAKNTSGQTETLMIAWKLYDENGGEIGTALATAEDLADGSSADFEGLALADFESIKSFELDNVVFLKAENNRLQGEIDKLK